MNTSPRNFQGFLVASIGLILLAPVIASLVFGQQPSTQPTRIQPSQIATVQGCLANELTINGGMQACIDPISFELVTADRPGAPPLLRLRTSTPIHAASLAIGSDGTIAPPPEMRTIVALFRNGVYQRPGPDYTWNETARRINPLGWETTAAVDLLYQ